MHCFLEVLAESRWNLYVQLCDCDKKLFRSSVRIWHTLVITMKYRCLYVSLRKMNALLTSHWHLYIGRVNVAIGPFRRRDAVRRHLTSEARHAEIHLRAAVYCSSFQMFDLWFRLPNRGRSGPCGVATIKVDIYIVYSPIIVKGLWPIFHRITFSDAL